MIKQLVIIISISILLGCNSIPDSTDKVLEPITEKEAISTNIQEDTLQQFKWNITHGENEEPYYEYYSIIKFIYASKEYTMDTLFSRVFPCEIADTADPTPCINLTDPLLLGAYFGADGGLFCDGQIIDRGDSLTYLHSCSAEEDEGLEPEEFTSTFLK